MYVLADQSKLTPLLLDRRICANDTLTKGSKIKILSAFRVSRSITLTGSVLAILLLQGNVLAQEDHPNVEASGDSPHAAHGADNPHHGSTDGAHGAHQGSTDDHDAHHGSTDESHAAHGAQHGSLDGAHGADNPHHGSEHGTNPH